jgi:hypothetical protein
MAQANTLQTPTTSTAKSGRWLEISGLPDAVMGFSSRTIFAIVLAFNLFGDRLCHALDQKPR